MANGGAYLIAFVIGLAILLTWAIVEIVRREGDGGGGDDPREIPEGDSDLQVGTKRAERSASALRGHAGEALCVCSAPR